MFTNTLKNRLPPVIRQPGEYNLLNNLEESFLLQKNEPEFARPWAHPWDENQLKLLREVYDVSKNYKISHGYSKSTNKEYLRMFIIKYYASDGFFVFPSYFTYSEKDGVSHTLDPAYKDVWDNFESRVENFLIKTKWLTHLTFNHVLSDGRIVEHVFDPANIYKNNSDEDMFFNMRALKQYDLALILNKELNVNDSSKNIKTLKI